MLMSRMARALGMLSSLMTIATSAGAQQPPRIELELGLSYIIDRSVEIEAPDIGAKLAGLTVWVTKSWGISAVRIATRGFDLREPLVEISDRLFLGSQHLRYFRVVVRHRRTLTPTTKLLIGAGIFGGGLEDVTLFKNPNGLKKSALRTRVSGIAGEVYLDQRVTRYFGLRVGVTTEGIWEARMIQPVFLGVVSY